MAPKLPDLNFSDSDYEDPVDVDDHGASRPEKKKGKGRDTLRSGDNGGKDVNESLVRVA